MKKLQHLLGMTALVTLTAFMTGCGGGDDPGSLPPPTTQPPPGLAPQTVAGRQVTLVDADPQVARQQLRFQVVGNNVTIFDEAGTEIASGQFQYTRTGDNEATIVVTTPEETRTITVNFTTATAGTYAYTSTTGATGTGQFQDFIVTVDPGPGNGNGNGNGPVDPGTNPPASLAGRGMFLEAGGGVETLTFPTANQFNSNLAGGTAGGTYTYALTGNTATFNLEYTTPQDFAGDRYDLTLTYTGVHPAGHAQAGQWTGTWSGTWTIGGAQTAQSGGFTLFQP